MSLALARHRVSGCYVTVPTLFHDADLEVNIPGIRRHVCFLIDGGIETGSGVLLAFGAAGGFTTMPLDERIRVSSAIIGEAANRVPVAMGAQSAHRPILPEKTKKIVTGRTRTAWLRIRCL